MAATDFGQVYLASADGQVKVRYPSRIVGAPIAINAMAGDELLAAVQSGLQACWDTIIFDKLAVWEEFCAHLLQSELADPVAAFASFCPSEEEPIRTGRGTCFGLFPAVVARLAHLAPGVVLRRAPASELAVGGMPIDHAIAVARFHNPQVPADRGVVIIENAMRMVLRVGEVVDFPDMKGFTTKITLSEDENSLCLQREGEHERHESGYDISHHTLNTGSFNKPLIVLYEGFPIVRADLHGQCLACVLVRMKSDSIELILGGTPGPLRRLVVRFGDLAAARANPENQDFFSEEFANRLGHSASVLWDRVDRAIHTSATFKLFNQQLPPWLRDVAWVPRI